MTRVRRAAVIALAVLVAACGSSPASPSTTPTPTASTRTFEGKLDVGGSSFYSFSASQAGTVSVILASLSSNGRAALVVPVQVGLGTPAGVGCAVETSVETTPGLTPQFTAAVAAGIHCLRVADIGQLPSGVTFAIRFTYP